MGGGNVSKSKNAAGGSTHLFPCSSTSFLFVALVVLRVGLICFFAAALGAFLAWLRVVGGRWSWLRRCMSSALLLLLCVLRNVVDGGGSEKRCDVAVESTSCHFWSRALIAEISDMIR